MDGAWGPPVSCYLIADRCYPIADYLRLNTGYTDESMTKLTIQDLDLRGKRVFIRVDFNVPLKDGVVTDDTRIRETLPTLKLAIQKGGRLVLASHLGRPKGGPDPKYSLAPVAKKLQELLERPVEFAKDCGGADTEAKDNALKDGA